jgi:hypothetical protein
MSDTGAFHVVRKSHNDVIQGYEVYCNNIPFHKGSKTPLRQREARWIAEKLNAETGKRFEAAA